MSPGSQEILSSVINLLLLSNLTQASMGEKLFKANNLMDLKHLPVKE
jgi:hypothetical protein